MENQASKKNDQSYKTLPTALEKVTGIRIRSINAAIIAFAALLLILFLAMSFHTSHAYGVFQEDIEKYINSELAANTLRHSSDELTMRVRLFSITTAPRYMEQYFEEVASGRRENAVETLNRYLGNDRSKRYLESALRNSIELMRREYKAMLLVVEARGYPLAEDIRRELETVPLNEEEAALSVEEKLSLARELVHDEIYRGYDERIDRNVAACILHLTAERAAAQRDHTAALERLFLYQRILAFLLMGVSLCAIALVNIMVMLPMNANAERVASFQPLPMKGAYELRCLVQAYNTMYMETQRHSAHLRYQAEHDALTGLYNRGAFEKIREEYADKPIALMLIDVDLFKEVNDTYGHDAGDQVLRKVAGLLDRNFRLSDYPFRIGGDEFAVIMVNASSKLKNAVQEKLSRIAEKLRDTSDGLPPVTMSIGVAFCDREDGTDDIYKDADRALYAVKTHGRNGCEFFGEQYIRF